MRSILHSPLSPLSSTSLLWRILATPGEIAPVTTLQTWIKIKQILNESNKLYLENLFKLVIINVWLSHKHAHKKCFPCQGGTLGEEVLIEHLSRGFCTLQESKIKIVLPITRVLLRILIINCSPYTAGLQYTLTTCTRLGVVYWGIGVADQSFAAYMWATVMSLDQWPGQFVWSQHPPEVQIFFATWGAPSNQSKCRYSSFVAPSRNQWLTHSQYCYTWCLILKATQGKSRLTTINPVPISLLSFTLHFTIGVQTSHPIASRSLLV